MNAVLWGDTRTCEYISTDLNITQEQKNVIGWV